MQIEFVGGVGGRSRRERDEIKTKWAALHVAPEVEALRGCSGPPG